MNRKLQKKIWQLIEDLERRNLEPPADFVGIFDCCYVDEYFIAECRFKSPDRDKS